MSKHFAFTKQVGTIDAPAYAGICKCGWAGFTYFASDNQDDDYEDDPEAAQGLADDDVRDHERNTTNEN